MSPASQAPLIKTGMVSQGSQNLALGLAKTAASQLDEFVCGPGFLEKATRRRSRNLFSHASARKLNGLPGRVLPNKGRHRRASGRKNPQSRPF